MIQAVRPDRRVGLLLAGAGLLLFGAFAATVVLPSADPAIRLTSASPPVIGAEQARGMRVYRNEGCWYCHTMQVREVAPDAGFGRPLQPGDYKAESPVMLGSERLGPDLTHVGSRLGADAIKGRLRAKPKRGSSMPTYSHLSQADLDALTAYLLSHG